MLLSYNWLKEHVDLPESLTPEELSLKLTMSTVEVEGVKKQADNFENIVVGEILKVEKHQDADKLKVCEVDSGDEKVQIVCGGSNVKQGMKVALAKIGAKVRWHGEGELIELKKAKIRGVDSFGMICASEEIGLANFFPKKEEAEILDLTDLKLKTGTNLSEALKINDAVFDIDNKSMTHRPDLWGHYGQAREVSALYGKKLKEYEAPEIKPGKEVKLEVKVKDQDLCPRYMAVVLDNIKVGPSPEWMQKKLIAVGLRPINNIVDITNYVMFDLGQPLHAFDAEKLTRNKEQITIKVRRAGNAEKFKTLDGKEHELTNEMLVIADEENAVALAGVIGGENSEISNDTKTIIFESANFKATSIRRTALKLGLRTDSSSRFEKSLDPNNAELALKKAVALTLEVCPEAKVVSNVVDESDFNLYQGPIELSLDFIERKIGMKIEKKLVIKILESLGFEVKDKKESLVVKIPTWRATKDISIPEDLIEEISRIYGYDNIEIKLPSFPIIPPEENKLRNLERKIKEISSLKFGFTETYNYSFVSPTILKKLGKNTEDHVELENPIAKDRPYLRRSLLTDLVENLENNVHAEEVCLFEIGKVFKKDEAGQRMSEHDDDLLPRQDVMFGAVYASKNDKKPFYELSSMLSGLLSILGVDYEIKSNLVENDYLHPARSAALIIGEDNIGIVSELNPNLNLDFPARIAVAEINLNRLVEYVTEKKTYKKISSYPTVKRDIAFVADKNLINNEVIKEIKEVNNLIEEVELFDVFEGKNISEDKKSMAYHITYQSYEKTLTAGEVEKIHIEVGKMLKEKFGAEVRK